MFNSKSKMTLYSLPSTPILFSQIPPILVGGVAIYLAPQARKLGGTLLSHPLLPSLLRLNIKAYKRCRSQTSRA